jgi:hypothetical protein
MLYPGGHKHARDDAINKQEQMKCQKLKIEVTVIDDGVSVFAASGQ